MVLVDVASAEPAGQVVASCRNGGRVARTFKHGMDRAVAAVALLMLAPLLLAIGSVVRLTSKGPMLYKQERIGLDGVPFLMWKFRTMTDGADAALPTLLAQAGRDGTPLFKVPSDPRVTTVGRWLRRWSLDELPQLVNVLRGQMSLVGPRPQVHGEVALYSRREWRRLTVRPGITGLWQVSGRSQLTWTEAIEFDLRYVDEWTLWSDMLILARTVTAVLTGRGAQ